MTGCTHVGRVKVLELPAAVDGCEECLETGDPWFHLRICLECGQVLCCDDSPNQHATNHSRETGHLLIRSLQPGETWCFCYADQAMLLLPQVRGETQIPPSPLGG